MQKSFYPKHIAKCSKCRKTVTEFCVFTFNDEISECVPMKLNLAEIVYQENYKSPIILCKKCYNKLNQNRWQEDRKECLVWQYS